MSSCTQSHVGPQGKSAIVWLSRSFFICCRVFVFQLEIHLHHQLNDVPIHCFDSLQIHWHDLAFFDPVLYESLRQLVADSQSWGDDVLEAVDLTFMVDLQNEEGGGQVRLQFCLISPMLI